MIGEFPRPLQAPHFGGGLESDKWHPLGIRHVVPIINLAGVQQIIDKFPRTNLGFPALATQSANVIGEPVSCVEILEGLFIELTKDAHSAAGVSKVLDRIKDGKRKFGRYVIFRETISRLRTKQSRYDLQDVERESGITVKEIQTFIKWMNSYGAAFGISNRKKQDEKSS